MEGERVFYEQQVREQDRVKFFSPKSGPDSQPITDISVVNKFTYYKSEALEYANGPPVENH